MRDNPLWPEQPPTLCQDATCKADATGQKHYGHCVHCRAHIGARTATQWSCLVKRPCPSCGRPW